MRAYSQSVCSLIIISSAKSSFPRGQSSAASALQLALKRLQEIEYRSHFGSRYKLGCCGHAGLFSYGPCEATVRYARRHAQLQNSALTAPTQRTSFQGISSGDHPIKVGRRRLSWPLREDDTRKLRSVNMWRVRPPPETAELSC